MLIFQKRSIDIHAIITDNNGKMFAQCRYCGELMRIYQEPPIEGIAHTKCHKNEVLDYVNFEMKR